MKRNLIFKVTSMLLVFSLIMLSSFSEQTFASNKFNIYEEDIVSEGKDYHILAYDTNNGRNITITCENEKYEIVIDNTNQEVVTEEFELTGKTFWGKDNYELVDKNIIDVSEEKDSATLFAQMSWNSKTKCLWDSNNEYYYRWGTSKYGNTYLKIGCKANYRLKYYKLKSWQKDMCKNDYIQSIKDCNTYYKTALALGAAADIAAAASIIAAIGTGGISVIVSALGCGTAFATAAINAHSAYTDAGEAYAVIKKWGTKC